MKIAIMHDFIGCVGGAEKLVLTLARALDADVITTELDLESVEKMGFTDVNIISMAKRMLFTPFKQIRVSLLFGLKNFTDDYDFFVLSGGYTHYAARIYKPNLWYCNSPVREFYDQREYIH